MTQSKTITQARQAMLDLIKSKNSTNNSTSKTINSSSSDNRQKIKSNVYFDIPNTNKFKRELDHMRRPAYTVRLNGTMI